jgi:hypothetical protein
MRVRPNAGEELTNQEKIDSKQNFVNSYSQDPHFLEFMIFGKRFIKRLLSVEDAKGLKLTMALRYNEDIQGEQMYVIPTAVDARGNELPYPTDIEFDEEQDDEVQIMDDPNPPPVRCPNSCN